MTVRAKFKVSRIEQITSQVQNPDTKLWEPVELRTIVLSPVYGGNDPADSENRKFWAATPSGSIQLGTVNPAAWQTFKLDGEYYVDFIPAD